MIGNKVRVVTPSSGWYGRSGEVIQHRADFDLRYGVQFPDVEGPVWYAASELELIE